MLKNAYSLLCFYRCHDGTREQKNELEEQKKN